MCVWLDADMKKGRVKEKEKYEEKNEKEEGRIAIFLLCKMLQVLIRNGVP